MIANDPYPAYAIKLAGPRGLDPILSHKAAKRADPDTIACPDCKGRIEGCICCDWVGAIKKGAPHCSHHYRHVGKIGNCLNTYQCDFCGDIATLDSSD